MRKFFKLFDGHNAAFEAVNLVVCQLKA
jgi:hypothetical protein